MTVPAANFHPIDDGTDWSNSGYRIYMNSGTGSFTTPVEFPGSGPVVVKKVILYAWDNSTGASADVTFYKARPETGSEVDLATVQGGLNAASIRAFSSTTITYAKIQRIHGPDLWLNTDGSSVLSVYGVKIACVD